VLAFGHPGEYFDVWGWRSNLYVQTQMIQAAQHSDSLPELEDGPYRDYSRKRYIEEFDRTNPLVFADEVGGTSFGCKDRSKYAHEHFPELATIIASRLSHRRAAHICSRGSSASLSGSGGLGKHSGEYNGSSLWRICSAAIRSVGSIFHRT